MKKVFLFALTATIACSIAACNNNSNTESNTTNEPAATPPGNQPGNNNAGTANQPEGLTLMTKSDCGNCHNANTKIVGPSYKDIAAKYPDNAENIAKLTDEVMKGVSGVWSSVPMPPHPALKKEDAEKMVGYILTSGSK